MSLEAASEAFLEGYRLGLLHGPDPDVEGLVAALDRLESDVGPFAYEGAGMASTILDAREEGGVADRTDTLLGTAAPGLRTFVAVGVGCGLHRLGEPPPSDAVVLDGYGFHLGLTGGPRGRDGVAAGPTMERGRGRALWFTTRGDALACIRLIGDGPHVTERWSGLGMACVFAGDPRCHATLLPELAGSFADAVRRGGEEACRLWSAIRVDVPERVTRTFDAMSA